MNMPKEIKLDFLQFLMIMCGFWFMCSMWFWYCDQQNYMQNKALYERMDNVLHEASLTVEARMNAVMTCEQQARRSFEVDDLREEVSNLKRELKQRREHLQLMTSLDWR